MRKVILFIVTLSWISAPARAIDFLEPPLLSARAAVLLDAATGEVLFAKDAHRRLPPASTTKVLTALIALERLSLNDKVSISPSAADTVPSRLGLEAGELIYVQDLLYGLMLKSGNDAAEAIAEAVAGSVANFAQLMNARAWRLGARDSHFVNPHGLNEGNHFSSAYDLALIFRSALQNPVFAEIVRTRNAALRVESGYRFGGWRVVTVRNSNRLLSSYYGARGGKTGYTRAARSCFVGAAERGAVRLIAVVLGSSSSAKRWQDTEALFEYGFTLKHGGLRFKTVESGLPKNDNPS